MEVQGLKNAIKVIGTLYEKNLRVYPTRIKDNNNEYFDGDAIYGDISLKVNGQIIKFKVYQASYTKKREENQGFKGWNTILKTNISEKELATGYIKYEETKVRKQPDKKATGFKDVKIKLPADATVSRLEVKNTQGGVGINTFVDKNQSLREDLELQAQYANQTTAEDSSQFNLEGFIRNVRPEIKNEVETGCGFIDFIYINWAQKAIPLTLKVDEEYWEGVRDNVKINTTCPIDGVISTGQKIETKQTGGWGKRQNIQSGFALPALYVTGGDDAFLEGKKDKNGHNLYASKEYVKSLMEERAIEIEAIKEKAKNRDNSYQSQQTSFQNAPTSTATQIADDEDIPF